MKVVPIEADPHFAVRALLPWYAMNALDAADAAQVESHLAGCPSCRTELELERRLQAAQPLSIAAGDVDRGWTHMRKLIRSEAPRAQPAAAPWLRWVLVGQLAVIALFAVLFVLPRSGDEAYRALGTPSAGAAANALVMFRPAATEQEIRAALRAGGARLVDGPTASNAYLLRVTGEDHAEAIARLRSQPAVMLAESLDAKPGP
jgi:hypothetical protein